MVKRIDYLNPRRTLVDETVDWLCGARGRAGCIRKTPEGAWSLAHIMVIVPTAQSGRNLRLALARKAALLGRDGLLPPRIAMSNALLVPNGVRIATETEELAVMAETLRTFELRSVSALFPKPPAQPTVDWALAPGRVHPRHPRHPRRTCARNVRRRVRRGRGALERPCADRGGLFRGARTAWRDAARSRPQSGGGEWMRGRRR